MLYEDLDNILFSAEFSGEFELESDLRSSWLLFFDLLSLLLHFSCGYGNDCVDFFDTLGFRSDFEFFSKTFLASLLIILGADYYAYLTDLEKFEGFCEEFAWLMYEHLFALLLLFDSSWGRSFTLGSGLEFNSSGENTKCFFLSAF